MRLNSLKDNFKEHPDHVLTAAAFLIVIFGLFFLLLSNFTVIKDAFTQEYRLEVPTGAPVTERLSGAVGALENQVDENIAFRDQFNELYGLSHLLMNRHIIRDPNYGNLFKTTYGQTTYAVGEKNIAPYAVQTFHLAKQIEAAGIPFLYVQAPFKLPAEEQQLPASAEDYSNANADRFLALLDTYGIATYDLRADFRASGKTQNELFFNTDHHWSIDGAFLATGLLAECLNERYDFGIEARYYNIDNFTRTTYEDFYIGSMGRRVGRIYGGLDDFTLITPNFKTDYTLHEWDYGVEKVYQGSFDEAILVNSYMDESAPLDTNRYAVYHGDNAELQFLNHLVENDKKILLIKDSFSVPVYSFLSLGVGEVRAIDVRLFTGDVAQYAIDFAPDAVVLMYNADSLSKEMFLFQEKSLTPAAE